jgi:glycosyltransferase involved in cell wall biosynthesis
VATKVLIVETHGGLGGMQKVTLDLATSVDPESFEPHVLFLSDGLAVEETRRSGITTSVLAGELRGAFTARVYRVRRFVTTTGPDLIQANGSVNLLEILVAGRITRTPVVWYQQDPYFSTSFHARKLIASVTIAPPAATIFGTQIAEQSIASRIRTLRKTRLITNGVVPPDTVPDAARVKDELEIRPESRLIAMFGRVTALKGPDVLIRAIGDVAATHADAEFLVVGPVDEADRRRYTELASDLRVADKVRFLGPVSEELKWGLMAAAEVVVHASSYEPFGLVIAEAMFAGTPVVAARSWGPEWIIDDEETGLLVDVGDSAQLARAVVRILGSPKLASTLSANARAAASHRFRFDSTVTAVEEVWRSVLPARAVTRPESS